jgi:4-amino-4-deoxy-L-arabinose transferase-like glycosyltransferase
MIRRGWVLWTLVVVVWFAVYVPSLFHPALLDDADSVHAEAAREMVLRHGWVTLYVDGVRYLEKAPLMYWAIAADFEMFGVTEWSARLPLALAVLGLMAATFALGRRAYGDLGGLYSGLIIGTGPGIFLYTRFLIPDVLVALWLTLSLYFFYRMVEQERPSVWLCWGLAASVALNVLTKSLIGLAFPGMVILLYLAATGNLRFLGRMRLASSAAVFLAIAAPWHVLAALHNPAQPSGPEKGFLWFYFINEQFLRYLNRRIPHDYGKVPLALFWVLAAVWLIPWSCYLGQALAEVPGRWRKWRSGLNARERANLLAAIWALVILLFFSFSSRQEYYMLPALPPLALVLGGWLGQESEYDRGSLRRRSAEWISAVLMGAGIAALAVVVILVRLAPVIPRGTDLAAFLTEHPGKYKLSLGHLSDLTVRAMGAFHVPLLEVGVALALGLSLNWLLRRRSRLGWANAALVVMTVVLLVAVHQAYVIFNPILSSKKLALAVEQVHQPGDPIVINGDYEWGSTVNFYTGFPVLLLNGRRADLWFGSFFPDAPKIFLDSAEFDRLWNGTNRVFLFTDDFNRAQALAGIDPSTVHEIAREGSKAILSNRP